MANPKKILIVEDESIVALNLQSRLEEIGYEVTAAVSSGEAAIAAAETAKPDLVLMDIRIRGKVDGIEAANQIRTRYHLPVIYLTAYADKETLERAKITEPFGYLLKPFESRELTSSIEIALYKHRLEQQLKQREQWLATTLRSISDGIITTDENGVITYINPVAETLTAWQQSEAVGRPLSAVFTIIYETTRESAINLVNLPITHKKTINLQKNILLITKNGTEIPIDHQITPLENETENSIGSVLVFHDISERKLTETALKNLNEELEIKVQQRTAQLQQTVAQLEAEIAERRLTEEALRHSEERFRNLVETSSDWVWEVDQNGTLIYSSPQVQDILGYQPEEVLGKIPFQFMEPAEIDRCYSIFAGIVTEKQPINCVENRVLHKNGHLVYIETSGVPFFALDGNLLGYRGINRNITERKQAEKALQESQAKFQKLAANLPGMIYQYIFHPDGEESLTYVSASCRNIYELEAEELLQNPRLLFELTHIEQQENLPELIAPPSQNLQPWRWEGQITTPSGLVKWIQAISRPEKEQNGDIVWDGIVIDITDRKQAELALNKSESRLRLALNAACMGTWDWDIESGNLYWSEQTELIFGFTPGTFPGTYQAFVNCIHPEDRDILNEALNSTFEEKIPYEIEHRILWSDNSIRWVSGKGNVICNSAGKLIAMSGVVTDITERKQAENALRDSEFKLRTIIENSEDAISLKDKEGYYLLINPAGCRFLGRSLEEVLGKRDQELFTPETGQYIWEFDQRVMQSGRTWVFEEEGESDGIRRTFLSTKCPYFSVNGELMGVIAICRNITESKLAQETMRRQLAAVEAASDGIAIVSAAGQYIYLNESHVKIFGYDSAEEMIGKTWHDLYERAEIERLETEVFPILAQAGKWQGEITAKKRDGSTFAEELSLSLVADGELICVCRDISDRKQVEEKLRLLERSIAASSNGIIISDAKVPDKPVIYVNEAFERMTGYSAIEVIGKNCRFLQGFDRNQQGLKKLRAAMKEGAGCSTILRNYRKDGSLFWNELSISPIYDADGTLTHFIGIQTDISERKHAEEEVRAISSRLSALIENLQAGVLVKNEEQQVVLLNQAFCDLFNIDVIPAALIGADFSEFPQEYANFFADRDEFIQRHQQIIEAKEIVNNEEILMANGKVFERDFVPIWVQGNYSGHLWMYRDITERKQAETALRISQERLQYLLSSSPAVIYSAKTEGDYGATFMSENIFTMMGYEAREFVENPGFWASHIHPEDAPRVFANLPQLFEEGYHIHEYRFLDKDGNYRWIYDQVKLIRDSDGNPIETIGYWADITDRKLAETALQEAKDQLQAVLDAVPGFVSWISSDLHYIGVNQNLATSYNLTPEAFIGQPVGFLENNYVFAENMRQFFASPGKAASLVIEQKINDSIRNYLIASQKYQQGTAAVSVGIDITERKQAESELRTSLKEKEVLLKEIHHRVKNNLQVISSLLKLQSAYIKDEHALALFNDSYNRVRSMALIHEKLYQSSSLARIDAADYIRNLTDNLFRSYAVSSTTVELKMEVEPILLDIDTAIPCGLMINELVSNSLKYAFVNQNQGEINIKFLQQERNQIYLLVSDNGVGLPSDFELEQTESLGLQLVYNLTDQLDGELKINSDNGTSFEIKFQQQIKR